MKLEPSEALGLTYVVKSNANPDATLPTQFVQLEEIEAALADLIQRSVGQFDADRYLDIQSISNNLFNMMLDAEAILIRQTQFAGRYFKYDVEGYKTFRSQFLSSDPYYLDSKEIGDRYFSDSFAAIERSISDGSSFDEPINEDTLPSISEVKPISDFFEDDQRRSSFISRAEKSLIEIEDANLSNLDKAQAHGYLVAVKALAETPNPPVDIIWSMLNRANSIAGIASFFVGLVALIVMVTT